MPSIRGALKKIKKPVNRAADAIGDEVRGGARAAGRSVSARAGYVRSEFNRADRAIFGGEGLRKNLKRLKKELKNPGSTTGGK